MAANVGGFPVPSLQWRLNGANIPGATSNGYPVASYAVPTNAGSYTVIAANAGGAVVSDIATVVVVSAVFTFHDDLPASGFDSSQGSGMGRGNNVGATRQTGETNHAGKVGGSSVWFVWQAAADGIATFRTRGSGFDTVLAAYTGNSVTNLTPVASDEDRAGYLTSEISFNALAGTNYAIAIDGFAAAQGNIVLAWTNDTSVTAYPRVISQPLSVTAYAGDTATFSVSVAALVPAPTYQWYFGCTLISGATNASLTITNVRNSVVGNYSLRVTAGNGQSALSETVALQLGIGTQTIARDKPEDLDLDANTSSFTATGKGGPNSFVSVSAGTVSSLNYNTGGYTTQQAEPAPCAVIGGASAWVALKPTVNGVFVVDTIGSRIDTVLSVYRKTNLFYLSSGFITCDDNSAPDRLRSVVRFSATSTAEYLIVVDGVGGTDGDVTLNWRLATAPTGGGTGANQSWLPGQTLTLTASSNAPFLLYQWLFNGGVIRFATNQTFSIAGVVLTNSGLYSVVLSNFAGAVTNTVANVTVAPPVPPHLDLLREISSGTLRFRLQGSTQAQVIEVSSNLSAVTAWSPIFTNTNGPLNYLDPATNQARRFYRTKLFP